jgi:hypothetical protein
VARLYSLFIFIGHYGRQDPGYLMIIIVIYEELHM